LEFAHGNEKYNSILAIIKTDKQHNKR